MRVTRKALLAENRQLKQQLKASGHHSRRSLNDHVALVNQRNLHLLDTVQEHERTIEYLKKLVNNTPAK